MLKAGYKGDLNVIDYEHLQLGSPYVTADLPAGGKRLLQKAEGYDYTIKSGQVTFRNGEYLGVHPGVVLRGPQTTELAMAVE